MSRLLSCYRFRNSLLVFSALLVLRVDSATPQCKAQDDSAPALSALVEFDPKTNRGRIICGTTDRYLSVVAAAPGVICLRQEAHYPVGKIGLTVTGQLHGVSIEDGKTRWSLISDEKTYSKRFAPSSFEPPLNGRQPPDLVPVIQIADGNEAYLFVSNRQGNTISRSLACVKAGTGEVSWQHEIVKTEIKEQSNPLFGPYIIDDWVLCGASSVLDRKTGEDAWRSPGYQRLTSNAERVFGWTAGSYRGPNKPERPGQVWSKRRFSDDMIVKTSIPYREELLGASASRIVFLLKSDTGGSIQLVSRDVRDPSRVMSRSAVHKDVYYDSTPVIMYGSRIFFGWDITVGVDLETGEFLFVERREETEVPTGVAEDLLYTISRSGIRTRNMATGLQPTLIWTAKQIPVSSVPNLRSAGINETRIDIDPSQFASQCHIQPIVILNRKMYFVIHN
jgi:hypothetical protein